jgi:iron complex transport system substrate-binding protein
VNYMTKVQRFASFHLLSVLLGILVGLGAACDSSSGEVTPSLIEVTDQLGRTVAFQTTPERIISLAPSNTEVLFALGLGDQVVGTTDYCNSPPEVEGKPRIGGFSTPDLEKVVALSPDLVLAASIHEESVIPGFEDRGITVFALAPETLEEVIESIALVGRITGQELEALELVGNLEERMGAVTFRTAGISQAERPKVLYVTWHDPLMVAGSGTLIDGLIQKAGGINIADDLSEYQLIDLEVVLSRDPDVIIAGTGHGEAQALTLEWAETEPRLKETSARQHGRVHQVDADIASRPGPRIVDALEQFGEFLQPGLFKEAP